MKPDLKDYIQKLGKLEKTVLSCFFWQASCWLSLQCRFRRINRAVSSGQLKIRPQQIRQQGEIKRILLPEKRN